MGQFNGGTKRGISPCGRFGDSWCSGRLDATVRNGTSHSCIVSWSQWWVSSFLRLESPKKHCKYENCFFIDAADDLSTHHSGEEVSVTGLNSILPKEHGHKFYSLPIIRHLEKDVCAIAAWDSSIHDSLHLNRVTDGNFNIYQLFASYFLPRTR